MGNTQILHVTTPDDWEAPDRLVRDALAHYLHTHDRWRQVQVLLVEDLGDPAVLEAAAEALWREAWAPLDRLILQSTGGVVDVPWSEVHERAKEGWRREVLQRRAEATTENTDTTDTDPTPEKEH